MVPVLHLALLSAWTRATMPPYVPVAPSRVLSPQLNLLEAAMDGDISAVLEVGALTVAGAVGVASASSLVKRDLDDAAPPSPPAAVAPAQAKMAVAVDLGENGEPKGVSRLLFKPLLPRSELVLLQLRLPLGLLIEEREEHGGTIAVKGALPDYSAFRKVEEDDIIRAVTAYAMVAGDAPMWQQVTSGTPVGDVALKRLIFRTDESTTYRDVKDAIASHRESEGGDNTVTLVLERALNSSAAMPPRDERARLEPLQDVIARDLSAPTAEPSADGQLSLGDRAKRLLAQPIRSPRRVARRASVPIRCSESEPESKPESEPSKPESKPSKPPPPPAQDEWRDAEDWALLDLAPSFTVGRGRDVSTFWSVLASSTPQLAARSAVECETRWRALCAKGSVPDGAAVGPQPAVLEEWERLPDGRFTGRLSGEASYIWLTVALEGRLADDPRMDAPSYVEAVGGRIYELSRARGGGGSTREGTSDAAGSAAGSGVRKAVDAAAATADGLRLPGGANPIATAAAAAVLAGGIGFGVGMLSVPPPPPPPPPPTINRIFLAPSSAAMRGARPTDSSAYPPVSGGRAAAPLTIEEQRQRQELRVDRDKARLAMLQQKLKEDEQALSEYNRIVSERGAGAEAVKLVAPSVFPPDSGPRLAP